MTAEDHGLIVVAKLIELGVDCSLVGVTEAPQLIRVDLAPEGKTRMFDFHRVHRADDLAYALGAATVRITAPIAGRSAVGVEIARQDRQNVSLRDLPQSHYPLITPIGTEIDGRPALLPIVDAPHTLVAGSSGGGKTVCLHTILAQLLAAHTPAQLQVALIDLKRVELIKWERAPHVAVPVADDARKAITQLRGLVLNMERRYKLLARIGARDITEANDLLPDLGADPLSYVLCVADELAELMMESRKEVEPLLVRLAQKGRAAGVHLILATQYPKSEVVTGLLRVNLPTRIAFGVTDKTASRVVLDQNGAEDLLGKGDGLLSINGLPPVRFQSAMTTQDEIDQIVRRTL